MAYWLSSLVNIGPTPIQIRPSPKQIFKMPFPFQLGVHVAPFNWLRLEYSAEYFVEYSMKYSQNILWNFFFNKNNFIIKSNFGHLFAEIGKLQCWISSSYGVIFQCRSRLQDLFFELFPVDLVQTNSKQLHFWAFFYKRLDLLII